MTEPQPKAGPKAQPKGRPRKARAPRAEAKLQQLVETAEQTADRIAELASAATAQLAETNVRIQEELQALQTLARQLDGAPNRPINRDPSSAGAKLLAIQLVASGTDRGEIEERLREEFSIADPSKILGSVVGPGRGPARGA